MRYASVCDFTPMRWGRVSCVGQCSCTSGSSAMPTLGKSLLSRRTALTNLACAPAIIASTPHALAETASPAAVAPTPACTLTPAAISGPYYFDPRLVRRDITEGHPGTPLRLRFVVM